MRSIPALLLLALAGCKSSSPPVIHVASTLDCPKLIHHVHAVYPNDAKQKHTEGTVRLKAVITKKGEVSNIEVVKGAPLLIPAAIDAVRQWRYTPCVINSEAVEVVTSIDIDFNLSQ